MAFISPFLILLRLTVTYAFTPLTSPSISSIDSPGSEFDIKSGSILAPILQPRVPGSIGSRLVQEHISSFFRDNLPDWTIEYQNSTARIPYLQNENVPFVNIIARRAPPWTTDGEVGYLTLVAHFDSKLQPMGFIGAIDSAAPCAMLMHIARTLDPALTKKWDTANKVGMKMDGYDGDIMEEHKGIQIIFLDGEEAFGPWTKDDSIWGAKSLAATWEGTYNTALSTYRNRIDEIDIFVLLDLLGSKGPKVPSYYKTTHWAYKALHDLALKMDQGGKSETKNIGDWFPDHNKDEEVAWFGGGIGDDHLPFLERGAEVLHVIPSPFPTDVWHRIEDDGEHLDMETVRDWAVLMTGFAAEWLDLEGHMHDGAETKSKRGTSKSEL